MKKKKDFLFDRSNYKFVIIGIVFIILGFFLMSGGGSDNPEIFSEEIYSFRRIRLAPALILLGFAIQVYAILKSPKR
tara:strand:+ start:3763 stop:3993 length:231 start_codon:yes stop_codon:yes gene_type:complete